jgi:anti-sigma28 factor (negative regulator of flagellin synthesis)
LATSKKTSKRGGASKRPTIEIAHKTEMSFELDSEKIAAIKRCLEKGKLTITMTKVDVTTNVRADEPYLYD